MNLFVTKFSEILSGIAFSNGWLQIYIIFFYIFEPKAKS